MSPPRILPLPRLIPARQPEKVSKVDWIFYAVVTAFLLAAADVFVKLAAGKLSNSVALLIYGCCTFSVGLSWVLWQRFQGVPQYAQLSGMIAAGAIGLTFAMVTLGLFITFGAGAPISLASPLIRLGGLVLVSLVGLIFFKEPLTWRYVIGMLLAGGGIYLIITR